MSLTNVAYNATYNWADPSITRLEEQALNPMLNRNPIELGIAGREEEVLEGGSSSARGSRGSARTTSGSRTTVSSTAA